MTDINMNEVNEALKELRSEFDKKSQDLGKIEKLESILDKQEESNQALVKSLNEAKQQAEDIEEKFNNLEAEVKRAPLGSEANDEAKAELKAFNQFMKKGEEASLEKKYLRTDNNENGGYLAPSEYVNEIIKKITEISPVRQVARVITTTSKDLEIPKRQTLVSGGWIGEGETSNQSNSTYGIEKIPVNKMMVYTDVTFEMLKDSAFNIDAEISSDVAEDFAKLEGAAFINGDSVKKPEGLLFKSGITEVNSGAATELTGDSLLAIQGEIKDGYDLSYMFNRRTLHSHIRTLKGTTNDHYLFQPALNGIAPNTVAGLPYALANDMPDVAADTFPVLCGDYRRAYYIADSVLLETVRDGVTQATSGKVRFVFYKRVGGQVVLPEALAKIKISA
jgi:HK97 family phage major capsid protein